jgi:transcriptional regulator with XRE-family HTH domain
LCQKLGQRICRRREEPGLTQRGLTELANLSSQRQVWDIEHGLTGMNVETARRIAEALGWSLSQLFKGL